MKSSRGRKDKEETVEQVEDSSSDSNDDEVPEVVSNATMKTTYDQLTKQLEYMKQQMRVAEKDKRRRKQEMFIAQKKAKITKFSDEDNANVEETESNVDSSTKIIVELPKAKRTRKVYPSLNITVEPLTKIEDSRANSALDFKSRRLAKVHRQSVKSAVISYQKKLEARK